MKPRLLLAHPFTEEDIEIVKGGSVHESEFDDETDHFLALMYSRIPAFIVDTMMDRLAEKSGVDRFVLRNAFSRIMEEAHKKRANRDFGTWEVVSQPESTHKKGCKKGGENDG